MKLTEQNIAKAEKMLQSWMVSSEDYDGQGRNQLTEHVVNTLTSALNDYKNLDDIEDDFRMGVGSGNLGFIYHADQNRAMNSQSVRDYVDYRMKLFADDTGEPMIIPEGQKPFVYLFSSALEFAFSDALDSIRNTLEEK